MTRELRLYWMVQCFHQRERRSLCQYESYALLAQAEAAAEAYHEAGWDMVSVAPLWVEQGGGKRMLAAGRLQ